MTPTSLPTVLVTGFEPFADAPVNPSGDIVRRLVELGHVVEIYNVGTGLQSRRCQQRSASRKSVEGWGLGCGC